MSNIPENEKLTAQETAETENFAEDEFSTVFSAPTEHKSVANNKKKRYLLKAIAGILAVAILGGGTWAIIKFIPEKKDDTTVSSPTNESVIIKETKLDDIKTLSVKNGTNIIKFYSTVEKSTDSSSQSEVTAWYVEGVDKSYIDSYKVESFVEQFATITSVREIEGLSIDDCGLVSPTTTATIVLKNGSEYNLTIGSVADSLTQSYYSKLSDSDKIFLLENSLVNQLTTVTKLQFDATEFTPSFEVPDGADDYIDDDGNLTSFDIITIRGKNFDNEVVFKTNTDDEISNLIGFVVTSPSKRIAKNAEYLLNLFKSGLTVDGAYSFDTSDASLKIFGLDKPDFIATIDVLGKKLTYKFKLQNDGDCAVYTDSSKVISRVSGFTDLSGGEGKLILSSMMDYTEVDFYASWISLYSINDLKGFNVTYDGNNYNFHIEKNPDTEAEDSYIIKLNGKQIDCSSFQYLYEFFISMNCNDYTIDNLNSNPELVVEFVFNKDNQKNSKIEFQRSGASRYQYSVDGFNMGKTTSAEVNKFVKFLLKIANGEILENRIS